MRLMSVVACPSRAAGAHSATLAVRFANGTTTARPASLIMADIANPQSLSAPQRCYPGGMPWRLGLLTQSNSPC